MLAQRSMTSFSLGVDPILYRTCLKPMFTDKAGFFLLDKVVKEVTHKELFDILLERHASVGHGKVQKMEPAIRLKYSNRKRALEVSVRLARGVLKALQGSSSGQDIGQSSAKGSTGQVKLTVLTCKSMRSVECVGSLYAKNTG